MLGRPTCYSCFRPTWLCVCELVVPFEAHCNLLLLQHPHERKKYYATARLIMAAITNARLVRGIKFDQDYLAGLLAGQNAYLLYPSAEARDCEQVPLDLRSTVIVIDGTWAEAGKIVYRNPLLKTLPCLSFGRELYSNYRIRKQPRENYLSSLESIGHLLKLNAAVSGQADRQSDYDRLFYGFDQMIEQQLMFVPQGSSRLL